jgi:DNA-binding MarR family transcriptional regulator
MPDTNKNSAAIKLADLTSHLLVHCREKEIRFAEKNGLTQAEFRCLRYFSTNECMNNKQISAKMKLTPGRLTRIIDSLIFKKYMTRKIDKSDRRFMRVYLSQKGISIVQQLNNDYVDVHQDILSGIDLHQQKPMIIAMSRLVAAMKIWASKSKSDY